MLFAMRILYAILLLFLLPFGGSHLLAQSSVLASGNWYRLAVTEKGIYSISGSFLQEQGIDLNTIKPDRLGIFGFGGGMLPQSLSEPRFNDLPQLAVWVTGADDGRFDPQDQLIFYAPGPHLESYQLQDDGSYAFRFQKNLYADTAFFFLSTSTENAARIATAEAASASFPLTETYDDYHYHEIDESNILAPGSGREWYGEVFYNGDQQQYELPLQNLLTTSPVELRVDVLGRTTQPSRFSLSLAGQPLGEIEVDPILGGRYTEAGKEAGGNFSANLNSSSAATPLQITYQASGGRGHAHLNRFLLSFKRKLIHQQGFTFFRNVESFTAGGGRYRIQSEDAQAIVWEVTNPFQSKIQEAAVYQNGSWQFTAASEGRLQEFVIFSPHELAPPEWLGRQPNQDIKSGSVPELLIVTHPSLLNEAEELANLRRNQNQLEVKVVTTGQIYNEFSSGRQDITAIRNYVKWLYDQQPGRLKYLLLFGKGSYDYKDQLSENYNLVPTYQSRNSVHPIYSYPSDDYYGFLEEGEGEWEESYSGDHTLDIGVGRLPVKNVEEARAVVAKLRYYEENPATLGDWRTRLAFLADDGDNNRYQRDSELLTDEIAAEFGQFSSQKVYLDAYPQQRLPNQQLAPEANEAIEDLIRKGALIVNYMGHGNELRLADENILNVGMIERWENLDRLPFFVTATCEFGRHDDPARISGAERLILNPEGGAVGLVTTARPVFSNTNFLLSQALYRHIFTRENGDYLTLGEIFRRTKNAALSGRDNRNFILLADPSMRLAFPRQQVSIDSVFNVSRANRIPEDTLRALSTIRVYGSIVNPTDSSLDTSFGGEVVLTLHDKALQQQTRGDESSRMQFSQSENVLHRGRASVVEGRFSMEFVVPKNIIYQPGQARISMYALHKEEGRDAAGLASGLQIGGSQPGIAADQTPPRIRLFLDDESFVSGNITGEETLLLAQLWDEQGINLSQQQAGQQLLATLRRRGDADSERKIILNDFFTSALDSYQEGNISYPLENLEEGSYTLQLEAWDTHNNRGTAAVDFEVRTSESLVLQSFYNYPNPFAQSTTFVMDHNQAGEALAVDLFIYNSQGKLLSQIHKEFAQSSGQLELLELNLLNYDRHELAEGIYLAKVVVKRLADGREAERSLKFIVNN
ncbi:MAG: type IX secretion system sortase PorU [Cyclobacteriaceae bacterium]